MSIKKRFVPFLHKISHPWTHRASCYASLRASCLPLRVLNQSLAALPETIPRRAAIQSRSYNNGSNLEQTVFISVREAELSIADCVALACNEEECLGYSKAVRGPHDNKKAAFCPVGRRYPFVSFSINSDACQCLRRHVAVRGPRCISIDLVSVLSPREGHK